MRPSHADGLLCRHRARCKQGLMAPLRREFTLNMISEWFIEAANHTCAAHAVCLLQHSDLVSDCINVTLAIVTTCRNQDSLHMDCVLCLCTARHAHGRCRPIESCPRLRPQLRA
jgi:hypothetical protein